MNQKLIYTKSKPQGARGCSQRTLCLCDPCAFFANFVVKDCINSWLNRYKSEGIFRFSIKPDQGRKPVLRPEEYKAGILEAIKVEWESKSGKSVSDSTFNVF